MGTIVTFHQAIQDKSYPIRVLRLQSPARVTSRKRRSGWERFRLSYIVKNTYRRRPVYGGSALPFVYLMCSVSPVLGPRAPYSES
jgi:hypothetical protein